MKKRLKLIALILSSTMMLSACSGGAAEETSAKTEDGAVATPVEVLAAEPSSITTSLTYVGKVTANDTVNVTSKLSAQAKEVLVDVGDTVKKGQVLLILDDKDLRDQISTTEAQLKIAETGSISGAAQALFITQPALSSYLNKLEAELQRSITL